jgi:hypothetical protein
VVQTGLSTVGWQGRWSTMCSRASPLGMEQPVGSATPQSSSTMRDGDKMVTGGDESMTMEAGSTLHLGWGKLQVLLAWRVLGKVVLPARGRTVVCIVLWLFRSKGAARRVGTGAGTSGFLEPKQSGKRRRGGGGLVEPCMGLKEGTRLSASSAGTGVAARQGIS